MLQVSQGWQVPRASQLPGLVGELWGVVAGPARFASSQVLLASVYASSQDFTSSLLVSGEAL